MITTSNEVYEFTEFAIQNCRKCGHDDIAQQLDDAMHLGSSGLEILGAIKTTFVTHFTTLERVVDKAKLQEVINYVNRAFGMGQ